MSLCEIVDTTLGKLFLLTSDVERKSDVCRPDYSPGHVALLREWVKEHPGAAVDAGANVGIFTIALAPYASWVYAYEPQPFLACMCAGAAALNGLQNVTVQNCLLGSWRGPSIAAPIFDYRESRDFGRVEFGEESGDPDSPTYTTTRTACVKVTALDAERLWGPVSVVKVDVEGMECDVLRGASQLLSVERPLLLVEWVKSDVEVLWRLIDSLGYRIDDKSFESDWVCYP